MAASEDTGLRMHAEIARQAAAATYERQIAERDAEDRDKRRDEMRREAARQLEGLYDLATEPNEDESTLLLPDGILLYYEASQHLGYDYGWSEGRFLIADKCAQCDGWAFGGRVGGAHYSGGQVLASLGEALAGKLRHACEDEIVEPPPAKPTREQLADQALELAEETLKGGEGRIDPAAAAGVAIAHQLRILVDATYRSHGVE